MEILRSSVANIIIIICLVLYIELIQAAVDKVMVPGPNKIQNAGQAPQYPFKV